MTSGAILTTFVPATPAGLAADLAGLADRRHPGDHPVRVLIDGPRCADTAALADGVGHGLAALGRAVARVSATDFWRDASLRLEYGRTDEQSYAESWIDLAALRREVLDPLGPDGDGTWLPSLRDPETNRSTREAARSLPPSGALVLDGEMLIGRDLASELAVHLAVTPAARRRHTAEQWQWTLPVLDRWDAETAPARLADVTVRYDYPDHPAVRGVTLG